MNDDHEPGEWSAWPLPTLPRKGEREIIDLQDTNLAKEHRRRGGLPLSLQTGGIDMNNTGDSSRFDGSLELDTTNQQRAYLAS